MLLIFFKWNGAISSILVGSGMSNLHCQGLGQLIIRNIRAEDMEIVNLKYNKTNGKSITKKKNIIPRIVGRSTTNRVCYMVRDLNSAPVMSEV